MSIEQRDRPVPGDGEALVRIRATTVNRTDCAYRAGRPWPMRFLAGFRRPKVSTLGTEFAGVVEATGPGVTRSGVGDRVSGYCEGAFGAHAEYMTVGAGRLIARIPVGRSYAAAAPSMEGSHYALAFLRRAEIGAGNMVLVYGASGAIGSAAVQLAKSLGATVTALCGTAHVGLVHDLGADRVIDYQTGNFTEDPDRYDLVLDADGNSSFWKCRKLLKPSGLFSASEGWMTMTLSLFRRLSPGRAVVFPLPRRDPDGIRFLTELVESGEFAPVVDRCYPLDQIVEAYRYVETGQKVGNVVIDVGRAGAVD